MPKQTQKKSSGGNRKIGNQTEKAALYRARHHISTWTAKATKGGKMAGKTTVVASSLRLDLIPAASWKELQEMKKQEHIESLFEKDVAEITHQDEKDLSRYMSKIG